MNKDTKTNLGDNKNKLSLKEAYQIVAKKSALDKMYYKALRKVASYLEQHAKFDSLKKYFKELKVYAHEKLDEINRQSNGL